VAKKKRRGAVSWNVFLDWRERNAIEKKHHGMKNQPINIVVRGVFKGRLSDEAFLPRSGNALEHVVGQSPGKDLALIRFRAWQVPFLKLGESKTAVEGQKVIVIGNPTIALWSRAKRFSGNQ
jgi:hypothetical protein